MQQVLHILSQLLGAIRDAYWPAPLNPNGTTYDFWETRSTLHVEAGACQCGVGQCISGANFIAFVPKQIEAKWNEKYGQLFEDVPLDTVYASETCGAKQVGSQQRNDSNNNAGFSRMNREVFFQRDSIEYQWKSGPCGSTDFKER